MSLCSFTLDAQLGFYFREERCLHIAMNVTLVSGNDLQFHSKLQHCQILSDIQWPAKYSYAFFFFLYFATLHPETLMYFVEFIIGRSRQAAQLRVSQRVCKSISKHSFVGFAHSMMLPPQCATRWIVCSGR